MKCFHLNLWFAAPQVATARRKSIHVWQELTHGVQIRIEKKKPIDETTVHPVEPIMQHHGPWKRDFEFENGSGRFDFTEEDWGLKSVLGVVMVIAGYPAV